jgi:hypothetical protein
MVAAGTRRLQGKSPECEQRDRDDEQGDELDAGPGQGSGGR